MLTEKRPTIYRGEAPGLNSKRRTVLLKAFQQLQEQLARFDETVTDRRSCAEFCASLGAPWGEYHLFWIRSKLQKPDEAQALQEIREHFEGTRTALSSIVRGDASPSDFELVETHLTIPRRYLVESPLETNLKIWQDKQRVKRTLRQLDRSLHRGSRSRCPW